MSRLFPSYRITLLLTLPLVGLVIGFIVFLWAAAPPNSMTIAAGPKGGAFEETAYRYQKALAKLGIKLNIRFTDGMLDNYQLVSDYQSGVDFALLFGGITNQTKSPNLRSMGRVSLSPLWFFYRNERELSELSELVGLRIAVGPAIRPILTELFSVSGINSNNSDFHTLAGTDAAIALAEGKVDVAPLPFEYSSPVVQTMLRNPQIKLMSMSQADALVDRFPFLSRLTLHRGVVDLKTNIPSKNLHLVSITNAIVIRENLNPALISALAEVLKEVHGGPAMFKKPGEFPTLIDPEFSIPQQALDYYRNGPPMLSQYLPYWVGIYGARALAVTIAILAIAIPFFGYVKTIYQWATGRYLRIIFRDLGTLMLACESAVDNTEVMLIENQILDIESRLRKLNPYLQYSGMALTVEGRLDALRSSLIRKRAALKQV